MYWELWLSQVTASAALQCMLVKNKGGHVLCLHVGGMVNRLDHLELKAEYKYIESFLMLFNCVNLIMTLSLSLVCLACACHMTEVNTGKCFIPGLALHWLVVTVKAMDTFSYFIDDRQYRGLKKTVLIDLVFIAVSDDK